MVSNGGTFRQGQKGGWHRVCGKDEVFWLLLPQRPRKLPVQASALPRTPLGSPCPRLWFAGPGSALTCRWPHCQACRSGRRTGKQKRKLCQEGEGKDSGSPFRLFRPWRTRRPCGDRIPAGSCTSAQPGPRCPVCLL